MIKLTINRAKKLAIALIVLPVIAMVLTTPAVMPAHAAVVAVDTATADLYAAKCKMCHGDKAQKLYDATGKTDEQMVDAILKGKKAEKPPNMPAFEAKGIDAVQAKALVDYMKCLKP
jgi:mono/diheme cytochrome c family protein